MNHSKMHPRFLESNSTSHRWAFGAFAELLDNSIDSRCNTILIDAFTVRKKDTKERLDDDDGDVEMEYEDVCVSIDDDGCGMSLDELILMMGFGHSRDQVKMEETGQFPIGMYGNGFKSGSMRLGKTATVFTKDKSGAMTLAMLSQTFLKKIDAQEILIPTISFPIDDSIDSAALDAIQTFSPWSNLTALRSQFDQIPGSSGTRIVLSELSKRGPQDFSISLIKGDPTLSNGHASHPSLLELDFLSEKSDIRLTESSNHTKRLDDGYDEDEEKEKEKEKASDVEITHKNSLREYISILYLRPKIKFFLRGFPLVPRKLICELWRPRRFVFSLKNYNLDVDVDNLEEEGREAVSTVFGMHRRPSFDDHFGMSFYHKGRLILCDQRIGFQLSPDSRGKGVIGVIDLGFSTLVRPTHSKQAFIDDKNWNSLLRRLINKMKTYWNEEIHKQDSSLTRSLQLLRKSITTPPYWRICSLCFKWRRVDVPDLLIDDNPEDTGNNPEDTDNNPEDGGSQNPEDFDSEDRDTQPNCPIPSWICSTDLSHSPKYSCEMDEEDPCEWYQLSALQAKEERLFNSPRMRSSRLQANAERAKKIEAMAMRLLEEYEDTVDFPLTFEFCQTVVKESGCDWGTAVSLIGPDGRFGGGRRMSQRKRTSMQRYDSQVFQEEDARKRRKQVNTRQRQPPQDPTTISLPGTDLCHHQHYGHGVHYTNCRYCKVLCDKLRLIYNWSKSHNLNSDDDDNESDDGEGCSQVLFSDEKDLLSKLEQVISENRRMKTKYGKIKNVLKRMTEE